MTPRERRHLERHGVRAFDDWDEPMHCGARMVRMSTHRITGYACIISSCWRFVPDEVQPATLRETWPERLLARLRSAIASAGRR